MPAEDDANFPIISADGTGLAFVSDAENLVAGAVSDQFYHADLSTGVISLVSRSASGEPANGQRGFLYSISGDGAVVTFGTTATNLGPKFRDDSFQSYIWRRSASTLEPAVVAANGDPANDTVGPASISRDGKTLVFSSGATNIGELANSRSSVFRSSLSQPTLTAGLFSSVLPSSRSVLVDTPFSLFASLISTADSRDCRLRLGSPGLSLIYRLSDPLTNQPIGSANPSFVLTANEPQSFLLEMVTGVSGAAKEIPVLADCRSGASTQTLPAINSFVLGASAMATPDVIALAATVSSDGVIDLPSSGDFGAFSVASINLGQAGEMLVRTRITGIVLTDTVMCETVPETGQCIDPPAATVTTQVGAGATPTFSVFARNNTPVNFDPGQNRLIVEFIDSIGEIRGRTSVAIR